MNELLTNKTHLLNFGALFHLAFVVFHLLFWKLFDWINDLKRLSYVNRSIIQILNLRLIFTFLIFAYISYFHGDELTSTKLGLVMIVAISVFWLLRAIEQVVYFGVKNIASNLLLLLFILGSSIYAWLFYLVQFRSV